MAFNTSLAYWWVRYADLASFDRVTTWFARRLGGTLPVVAVLFFLYFLSGTIGVAVFSWLFIGGAMMEDSSLDNESTLVLGILATFVAMAPASVIRFGIAKKELGVLQSLGIGAICGLIGIFATGYLLPDMSSFGTAFAAAFGVLTFSILKSGWGGPGPRAIRKYFTKKPDDSVGDSNNAKTLPGTDFSEPVVEHAQIEALEDDPFQTDRSAQPPTNEPVKKGAAAKLPLVLMIVGAFLIVGPLPLLDGYNPRWDTMRNFQRVRLIVIPPTTVPVFQELRPVDYNYSASVYRVPHSSWAEIEIEFPNYWPRDLVGDALDAAFEDGGFMETDWKNDRLRFVEWTTIKPGLQFQYKNLVFVGIALIFVGVLVWVIRRP